ncbi:hypothetical protein R1flu_022063 [Riccia fluitans]|uniref:Alpha-galactosidase n=1 Tax=Riccia fluitans TaxID=41844 RepID=A0ABD1ZRH0_9MARC
MIHRLVFCGMGRLSSCDCLLAVVLLLLLSAGQAELSGHDRAGPLAQTPPRGWNSYDSFSWIVSEEEFLQNAQFVAANLSKHGYEYVVVDFLWYRRLEPESSVWSAGYEVIDEYGRLVPDPGRWPSTRGGKGFKPIADKVHAMGLKFGIHVMRGISTQAVKNNTKICRAQRGADGKEDCPWTAADVALVGTECSWMKACFMSVNTSHEGGLLFLNSLYQQYADWGVDFIKHDCVFGAVDLSVSEITAVSKAITKARRPMVYSLSPGVRATSTMAKEVVQLVHMYRVTGDDWDTWRDVLLHFSVARDFAAAGLIGAPGLQGGRSWPDLDMLPLGWLTDAGAPYGANRSSSLTKAEQRTQVTLWSIGKSPLMFGGDLRHIDESTLDLITNPTVLDINSHSTHNNEFRSSPDGFLPVVKLEDCMSATSTSWNLQRGTDNQMQVCWSLSSRPKYSVGPRESLLTGCLNWTEMSSMPQELTMKGGRGLLWNEDGHQKKCLVADKSAMERTLGFGVCNNSANQLWHLTQERKLVNEMAGLCAAVEQPERGWRIWVARGKSGQAYVAFFNLEDTVQTISTPLQPIMDSLELLSWHRRQLHQITQVISLFRRQIWKQLVKAYQFVSSKQFSQRYEETPTTMTTPEWRCRGNDVWEGKPLPQSSLSSTLVASVEPHGTVLLELDCLRHSNLTLKSTFVLCAAVLATIVVAIAFRFRRELLNRLVRKEEIDNVEDELLEHDIDVHNT